MFIEIKTVSHWPQIRVLQLENDAAVAAAVAAGLGDTDSPVQITLVLTRADEILGLYAGRLSLGKIEVIKEYDSDQTVNVFPGELVFSNLIGNAIDAAMPEGRLRLRFKARPPQLFAEKMTL